MYDECRTTKFVDVFGPDPALGLFLVQFAPAGISFVVSMISLPLFLCFLSLEFEFCRTYLVSHEEETKEIR